MRPVLLVAWREYAENAKTKGFWIGIFIFPLIITVSFAVQRMLHEATPTRDYVLLDQSGDWGPIVDEAMEQLHRREVVEALNEYAAEHVTGKMPTEVADEFVREGELEDSLRRIGPLLRSGAPEFERPRRRFRRVDLPASVEAEADLDTVSRQLKPYLRGDMLVETDGEPAELFAALLIPKDIDEQIVRAGSTPSAERQARLGVQYWSSNLADEELRQEFQRILNSEIRRREYLNHGMDEITVRSIQRTRVPFAKLNPRKQEGQEEVDVADVIRQWAPVGFVYLLWIAIFSISQMLLNNTIEEKSNRIIEVLLSSVTAGELMLGKLAGIAGIGLTTLGVWIGSLFTVLFFQRAPETGFASELFQVLQTSGLLPAFFVYFLLGYLLYSGIFLAIGSLCNTLKEAQNMMGPVLLILMVPLFTMMFIPKDPNGTLATVMSWIPLYTPFVMMNRAAADPPWFDVVGTLVVLLISTALVLWLTGKIFRIGILRTGQPPKLIELLRWVRS